MDQRKSRNNDINYVVHYFQNSQKYANLKIVYNYVLILVGLCSKIIIILFLADYAFRVVRDCALKDILYNNCAIITTLITNGYKQAIRNKAST